MAPAGPLAGAAHARLVRSALRRPGALRARLLAALVVLPALAAGPGSAEAAMPSGFTDELVAPIVAPTALAFTSDRRMLVTTQLGTLRVVRGDALVPRPALDLSGRICANSERGVLGVAADPAFAVNRFVYLYYTHNKHGTCPTRGPQTPVNRVSRFVLGPSDVVDPATETVLVDNIPSPNGNHNAGDLQFGKDGYLYVSVGDGACDYAGGGCAAANDAARDPHVLLGKILRVDRNGAAPATNPASGPGADTCAASGGTQPGRRCRETYASGLRNPFRMAFDPNAGATRFFINDVGQARWEEVNVGRAGADYGWNLREGNCVTGSTTQCGAAPGGLTNPAFSYGRGDGCSSITGGAFVPNGAWSEAFDDAYLFGDYVCGKIFKLTPTGNGGFTRSDFVTELGNSSAVHLAFGPDDSLYYTTYAGGGSVRRIEYVGTGNRRPTPVLNASPVSGPVPLTVTFDASSSRDPDGDALSFVWNFGDGSPERVTAEPRISHTYGARANFTATLRVRDARGAVSRAITIGVFPGNSAPVPKIESPASTHCSQVGETIVLRGSATDADDGRLPDSALAWSVIVHHNEHTHPFLGPAEGNGIGFDVPAPEEDPAASYLELRLSATDSRGQTVTISQDLKPKLSDPCPAPNSAQGVAPAAPRRAATCVRTVRGTRRADRLRGTSRSEALKGLAGDDRIDGLAGDDCLRGDGDDDLLRGAAGADVLMGGDGRDRLVGGAGADRLLGASGRDRLDGGAGNDSLNGGRGPDVVAGGKGNDRIDARNRRRDRIDCGRGRDTVLADRFDRLRNCERVRRTRR
jgi:glucose/arabinose dehydrogenase